MVWGSFNRWRRGWLSADEAELDEIKNRAASTLDRAMYKARNGLDLTVDELAGMVSAYDGLYEAYCRRNGTEDNRQFEESDRLQIYAEALKLAALEHPDHSAWPVRAGMRSGLLVPLETRLREKEYSWLRLTAVTAALASGSAERALALHAPIAGDSFLSGLAVRWANQAVMSYPAFNTPAAHQEFLAKVPHEDPWNGKVSGEVAELRWVLLAASFPDPSSEPCTTLRAVRGKAVLRATLKKWWDVVDRKTAIVQINWLLDFGHRGQLKGDLAAPDPKEPKRMEFVIRHRAELERHGIVAWDFARLSDVARSACTAEYIDDRELGQVLEVVARALRDSYASWQEFSDDYRLGCRYFRPSAGHDNCEICASSLWLNTDPRSPWRTVTFGGRG